jgi:ABC-2 type transport system ATP-binding protein
MVVPFGTTLHVSGTDAHTLDGALAPFRTRPGTVWTPAQPSLEDVFIRMMDEAPDNFDA